MGILYKKANIDFFQANKADELCNQNYINFLIKYCIRKLISCQVLNITEQRDKPKKL